MLLPSYRRIVSRYDQKTLSNFFNCLTGFGNPKHNASNYQTTQIHRIPRRFIGVFVVLALLMTMYLAMYINIMVSLQPLINNSNWLAQNTQLKDNSHSCAWKTPSVANTAHLKFARIPHVLHQSWKNNTLPLKFSKWQKSWLDLHQDWEYKLWTDNDNMELCRDHFPWMFERFQEFLTNINRADTARYMYMHLYGGFYADLDVECLQSHAPIASIGGVVVPLMSRDYTYEHNIPNPWLGSAPGHPFWIYLLEKIKNATLSSQVEVSTGPVVLYKALKEFEQEKMNENILPITYIAPEMILPYDWHNNKGLGHLCSAQSGGFDPEECKKRIDPDKNAYAITYWSHTWEGKEDQVSQPFKNTKADHVDA
ncbi:hypothetical protein BATDEDRAFT_90632 [Batrachochytrium dendrobatidis JAM81]|uniref:Uncharacterized protein n=2 Tax=Batrachochytrium dendrobatidis TaxID=109871 RepID=F4P8E7_BATDJ|nr:uncharacterized protein BATDEDRAFT_90632 [Batrachochytrium dendrobatidis JAM81]EGF78422.1 hypothetical protein BATDEDRAFT_90632 [Batrachochytrium dendrobatidis JAM81]KAJ8324227.1 hypothetical protein O5D80_007424 [Batrachochytrium dendrobatidis]KAK5665021.1 hypothetical protein QVD99_008555 [Batrachochytrium dendrobatidis]OAJ43399.1 hypothetical protein BDEG_26762 [Batrachochytrium dendrobatidis JEL423]|eukprot:XP_006680833.1 hypothetical protein BATDEDRAFT_90632 [Batrachochytrium dendrobatidis JAM81]